MTHSGGHPSIEANRGIQTRQPQRVEFESRDAHDRVADDRTAAINRIGERRDPGHRVGQGALPPASGSPVARSCPFRPRSRERADEETRVPRYVRTAPGNSPAPGGTRRRHGGIRAVRRRSASTPKYEREEEAGGDEEGRPFRSTPFEGRQQNRDAAVPGIVHCRRTARGRFRAQPFPVRRRSSAASYAGGAPGGRVLKRR